MEGKRRRAERLLEADPGLKARTVAQIVGCSHPTVVLARRALGAKARKLSKIERCEALLREDRDLGLEFVAEAVGCSYGTAYAAAKRLGVGHDRTHASATGEHQRWHANRGKRDPECPLCRAEDPRLPTP